MLRALLALALVGGSAVADDAKPADKLAAIKKEQEGAQDAHRKANAALPDDADGQKQSAALWKTFDAAQAKRFAAAVEIATADPKADVALPALEWVLTQPRAYYHPAGIAAMDEVTKHHAANPKVGKLTSMLGYFTPHAEFYPKEAAAAWAMIDAVAETNTDKAARAQAFLAKAHHAKGLFDRAEYKKSPDVESLAAAAEAAYVILLNDYGDAPRLIREGRGTVGEFAKSELFELRHLRIGKVAPDIEADGVDGKKLKLSNHRGKVVAVVFWAAWCGPCMAMVPHEREMVARLKDKPFALLGVNGDDTREKATETMAKEKMTWPSFWNGAGGPDGPISKAWNVRGWPTIYVLDAKGVIRFKNPAGKELEENVTSLLEELQKK